MRIRRSVPILQSFFKTGPGEYGEGDRFIGVKVPAIRAVCRECRGAPLDEIRRCSARRSTKSGAGAADARRRVHAGDDARKRRIYEFYLANTAFINNWDLVDCFGGADRRRLAARPEPAPLTRLARSKSLWERRIAIIATFDGIRRGEFDDTFRIADMLLHDEHDLIHKAVGWMLRKSASATAPPSARFSRAATRPCRGRCCGMRSRGFRRRAAEVSREPDLSPVSAHG